MTTRSWFCKVFCCLATLSVAVLCTGCPYPIPSGFKDSSRENLSIETTHKLVVGKSTREDVLLLLGEPDVASHNESWMTYGSVYGKGGYGFVLFTIGGGFSAGREKMEYRRLIVLFDENGLLTNAEFVDQECWETGYQDNILSGRTPPCVDVYIPGFGSSMEKPLD